MNPKLLSILEELNPDDSVGFARLTVAQAAKEIEALIVEARIDEIKWMQRQIPKKVKGVNYGTPETNPHGWAYETYIEAWKPVLKERLTRLTNQSERTQDES